MAILRGVRWLNYLTRILNSHQINVSTINCKFFWNIRNKRNFSRETEVIIKDQTEIDRIEKYDNRNSRRKQLGGWTEKRGGADKGRIIEFTPSEQGENRIF